MPPTATSPGTAGVKVAYYFTLTAAISVETQRAAGVVGLKPEPKLVGRWGVRFAQSECDLTTARIPRDDFTNADECLTVVVTPVCREGHQSR